MTIPGTPGKHNSPGTPGGTISIKSARSISNVDWVSKSGPEAKIAKMKDGTTHLAYKPGHAVDLDTGAVVAAELHPADEGDSTTLSKTLAAAEANLEVVDAAPRGRTRPNASHPPPTAGQPTVPCIPAKTAASVCFVISSL